ARQIPDRLSKADPAQLHRVAQGQGEPGDVLPQARLGVRRLAARVGLELPVVGRLAVRAARARHLVAQGPAGVGPGLDFRQDRPVALPGARLKDHAMLDTKKLALHTMMGNYPITKPLKSGEVRSGLVDFDFAEVKVANNLFKSVVRDAKYDVAELAIATYLQAKAYNKPYVLIPAVLVSRGQHHTIAYNAERGALKPSDLNGKRVGIRAYTVT